MSCLLTERPGEGGGERLNVQRTGLVGRVLEDNITLLVLVFTEGDKNDITVVDPDLLAKLATDETEALDTVEALKAGKSQHICLLRW